MGFWDDKVERAFLYADAGSIEEIISYLTPNEKGFWEHKFIPESQWNHGKKCLLCRRSNNKTNNPSQFKKRDTEIQFDHKSHDLEMGSPLK